MNGLPNLVLDNAAAAASLLGGGVLQLSLGQARQYFMRSDSEADNLQGRLNDLQALQIEEILHLVDNAAQDKSPQKPVSTKEFLERDAARHNAVKNLVDYIWEDALRAREVEREWINWRAWERRGRRTCEIPKFINFGLWTVFLFDLVSPKVTLEQSGWLLIGAIAVGLPFLLAGVCWLVVTRFERRVASRLDVPRRGGIRTRRFGDA